MLPKAHLTSHSRISGSRWLITSSRLSGSWKSFLIVLLCVLATSSASLRSIQFLFFIEPIFAWNVPFRSHQISPSVLSDSLWTHESQYARPPCPSSTPRVYSNSSPLSQWCDPTISSSAVPFCSYLQSFPASGSFPMSQLFAWGGQSTGVSASTSVLPMNIQDWSPLGWTGWISLQSKGLSRVFSNTTVQNEPPSMLSHLEIFKIKLEMQLIYKRCALA